MKILWVVSSLPHICQHRVTCQLWGSKTYIVPVGINIQRQDGTCQLSGAGVAKAHWSLLPAVQCPVTVMKAWGCWGCVAREGWEEHGRNDEILKQQLLFAKTDDFRCQISLKMDNG